MLPSIVKQTWTVFGALFNLMACGFHLGYPTVLFKDLRAKDSQIPLTLETESWITSSIAITVLLSILFVAPMMDRYGRKITHLALTIPNIVTGLMLYYAQNVTTIVLARLVYGIPCGGTIVLNAMIIGEFTSPEVRGMFLNAKTASIGFGMGFAHVLGLFFEWRMVALISVSLPVLSLLINLTWPESPAWSARHGHYERCEKDFYWLRGHSPRAAKELQALIQAEKERRATKILNHTRKPFLVKVKMFFSVFAQRDFQKPTLIMGCVFIIMEACGRHVFPAYAVKIVSAFTGDHSPLYYVVGLDSVIFLTTVGSCVVINMFKRRTLLFFTGSICSVLLLTFCLYLYLKSKDYVPKDNAWLPLTLLILYFIVLNIGTSPTVLTLLGEIYPLKHRHMGVVMSGILFSISLMIALKVTPAMIKALEVHGTFTVFALFMISALLYLYFNLPETQGRTLQEIEEYFNEGRNKIPLTDDGGDDEMIKNSA